MNVDGGEKRPSSRDRHVCTHRQTHRQTDRQTHTDILTVTHTQRQTDIDTDTVTHTYRQTDTHIGHGGRVVKVAVEIVSLRLVAAIITVSATDVICLIRSKLRPL